MTLAELEQLLNTYDRISVRCQAEGFSVLLSNKSVLIGSGGDQSLETAVRQALTEANRLK